MGAVNFYLTLRAHPGHDLLSLDSGSDALILSLFSYFGCPGPEGVAPPPNRSRENLGGEGCFSGRRDSQILI